MQSAPGVMVGRSGGLGTVTSVFVRGESNYNKILLDGIPLNEPGGTFEFTNLAEGNLDRIEIVRGPQSALFGSDAMASAIPVLHASRQLRRRAASHIPRIRGTRVPKMVRRGLQWHKPEHCRANSYEHRGSRTMPAFQAGKQSSLPSGFLPRPNFYASTKSRLTARKRLLAGQFVPERTTVLCMVLTIEGINSCSCPHDCSRLCSGHMLRSDWAVFFTVLALSCLSCTANGQEHGAFCTSKGYLAYETSRASAYGVPQNVLQVVRFGSLQGVYKAGEVTINSFSVHVLTCSPENIEISGWGSVFEHYLIARPPPHDAATSCAPPGPLQILEHHSDPGVKFDPAKAPPESHWLWSEAFGSYPLDAVGGDHQYFLVIAGSDKSAKTEIHHRRIATIVEKNQQGAVLHTLRIYQNTLVETID